MSKILIIEDDLAIAELEKDYLEASGFEVTISRDGTSGLALALTSDFDLILLDLMLPGIDGFAVCQELRQHIEIPIIMVSARREDFDKISGLGNGADDYITKPFSPGELVARVKAHIARYQRLTKFSEEQNDILEIKNLIIDKTDRRVKVNGEEKVLTNKEFDLLFFLASHPNRVYSKEELFSEIWEMTSLGGDIATVTVHIKKIREKIENNEENTKFIETIWGVGYRFKA